MSNCKDDKKRSIILSKKVNSSFLSGDKNGENCTSGSKMPMVAVNVVEVVCFMHCEKMWPFSCLWPCKFRKISFVFQKVSYLLSFVYI